MKFFLKKHFIFFLILQILCKNVHSFYEPSVCNFKRCGPFLCVDHLTEYPELKNQIEATQIFFDIQMVQKLKNANMACNLETMLLSSTNNEKIVASALAHTSKRKAFFKEVKMHWDQQNKHIVGKHNYEPGKSIIEHHDIEPLIKKYAGTGRRVGKESEELFEYREIVDFSEYIGIWKNKENTCSLPTTKGTIHYGKKGAHVIPAHPDMVVK